MIVIGKINDVTLYRELVRRGVSDYVHRAGGAARRGAPRCATCSRRRRPSAVGRVVAVVGAKGGVGASTVAITSHGRSLANWRLIRWSPISTWRSAPPASISIRTRHRASLMPVFSPDRVDTAFIERLLSKCTDHLSLLAAPATLERVYDFGTEAFDSIFDTLRTTMPCIVLDVPHQWSGWAKRAAGRRPTIS
ncbi:MAG: hypothetical protein MZV49_21435 [Rhodopseudomonas palustris]|nr:hypothetical protein [Rhodopseudomonas palustris]